MCVHDKKKKTNAIKIQYNKMSDNRNGLVIAR